MVFIVTLLPCGETEFFSCRDADPSRLAPAKVVYEEHKIALLHRFLIVGAQLSWVVSPL